MKYISVTEASKRWGITDRRIRILCNEGRIDGAIRLGWTWTIPEDTPKPRDGRVLRRFKNLDIRPGSVDVALISSLVKDHPINESLKDSDEYKLLIISSLEALLHYMGEEIPRAGIEEVYNGNISPALTLADHLLVLNFKSLMTSLIDRKERWCEKDLREVYVRLVQGLDDKATGRYRNGFTRFSQRDKEKIRVDVQMETLFTQYESSWKELNGIVSGVLLFGELLRISPYDKESDLFSYLILSGELIRKGILPPYLTLDTIDELRAAFSLAIKRGNYGDITSFVERAVLKSYKELFNV